MKVKTMILRYHFVVTLLLPLIAFAQDKHASFVYGDLLPDAPELAARGEHAVGVRTLTVVHEDQIDILNYQLGEDSLYHRQLTLEIWYPAMLEDGEEEWVIYDEVMGNANSADRPLIPFTFPGRARRGSAPDRSEGPYPLVIVSHGYTGSRLLFTYLTENLASKGYVVVSIDHMESTFRDAADFASTLLNRSLDDLFVLNEIARMQSDDSSFLSGLVNTDQTAIIGYSMGGYGAVNVAGGGYSPQAAQFFAAMANGSKAIQQRVIGDPALQASMDARIKAIVAMAPWGMERGVWNAEGLAGVSVPTFYVAGSKDDISGYENGIKAMYEGTVNAERYLLTYLNARHNIAPNPPPAEALQPGLHIDEYLRYADSVWDQRRINNINQHFITAFLGLKLKNKLEYKSYLDAQAFQSQDPWYGFKPRTSVGLELMHEPPGN